MILVTGATGQLGAATIKHLLKHTAAKNIVAFARDAEKAEDLKAQGVVVRIGSYDDKASIGKAMEGVDKVLLVSGLDPEHRFQQHKNVIDAARQAGVKHLVFTSLAVKDIDTAVLKGFLDGLFKTEDYLKQGELPYTILRNTLYTDGVQMFAGEQIFEKGIYLPAGDGKVPYALRDEMGEATANILLQSNGHEKKTYELTGSELYSYADVTTALTALSGKEVNYVDADAEAFPEQLRGFGVPEIAITIVSGFSIDTKNGQFEHISNDLETLLGRKPATLKAGLKTVYGL